MKAKLLPFLLALLLCLCSCQSGGNLGSELTVPLDRVIQALESGNTGAYESAFPPDFTAGYRQAYGDLAETLSALLYAAKGKNQSECGEVYTLRYELQDKEALPIDSLESVCTLDRFNAYVYTLPKEHISQAALVTVTAYLEGGLGEQSFENTYFVLCIDGVWYLHPMHFGTVLKGI